jgi:hypothetical protein
MTEWDLAYMRREVPAAPAVPTAGKPCEYNGGACMRRSCLVGQWCQAMRLSAAPAVREPLTQFQIINLARDAQIAFCLDKEPSYDIALARAIEQAHGIGGGK